ncbi:hypothetical protein BKA82DRAFT_358585 [Pisolithus tinctorius]|uniref:VHS domain-containing protein n=1 Tax=Pisolithus tinctorius Marx 270 TaxID=870435 RepID=A0A0C3PJW2_PISTI|nr:hypothetical protein BKA82DRAFT_358585 [Pisolithus tinctorius]KIO08479.1 hypothetical protein M404DRAFT_358585 [Pisolithus tinctorius Marx 270]
MFTKEKKPHSSITQLVNLLTGQDHAKESYDDLPELASSISLQSKGLQSTGPAEASRALRKKIKHGDSHQKYRALFILDALMANGDQTFRTKCMDHQLVDALKQLASDPYADSEVRRKLAKVLSGWSVQYKGEPFLSHIASVYAQYEDLHRPSQQQAPGGNRTEVDKMLHNAWLSSDGAEQKKKDKEAKEAKEEAKRKAKQEKAEAKRRAEEEARRSKDRSRRRFDFDKEKPQIINSIANASQASSNLINAMKLVNLDKESVATNSHVKDCLEKAKAARKTIVRYIQLVENEEMIGTLITANEQVIAAIQMHDDLVAAGAPSKDRSADIQSGVEAMSLHPGGRSRLQGQNEREINSYEDERNGSTIHPDLQDLSFGSLGDEQGSLPPPMRPSTRRGSSDDEWDQQRANLSEFSDFESEDLHENYRAGPSSNTHGHEKSENVEDPFADPFAD